MGTSNTVWNSTKKELVELKDIVTYSYTNTACNLNIRTNILSIFYMRSTSHKPEAARLFDIHFSFKPANESLISYVIKYKMNRVHYVDAEL